MPFVKGNRRTIMRFPRPISLGALRFPVLLLSMSSMQALADVRLPAMFGDHMVVQRDMPIHIWGEAAPGEAIKVAFAGQSAQAETTANGRWSLHLEPAAAGGPYTMRIEGDNTIEFGDVHIGDVWIASGQSNMDWPLARSNDAAREIAAAEHPSIRYLKVERIAAETRQEDVRGLWRSVTPATAGEFSGVAYFFARDLQTRLDIPIGVIQSTWGGTPAQAWTSAEAFAFEPELATYLAQFESKREAQAPDYEAALADWQQREAAALELGEPVPAQPPRPRTLNPTQTPTQIFNGMIAPLTPYAIRGVIWYQGENNANNREAQIYRRLFRALIEDWRREWGQGAFPFLFVQLASYARVAEDSMWPELREAQSHALGIKATGMAVTIDIGDSTDIHPGNKQEVGRRLALAARATTYGERDLAYSGPMYRQATREGSALRLWFDHADSGLRAEGGSLKGFEVAGADGMFASAEARILGTSVILTNPRVPMPMVARYAWAADPEGNLVNGAGLPASPFRTKQIQSR